MFIYVSYLAHGQAPSKFEERERKRKKAKRKEKTNVTNRSMAGSKT